MNVHVVLVRGCVEERTKRRRFYAAVIHDQASGSRKRRPQCCGRALLAGIGRKKICARSFSTRFARMVHRFSTMAVHGLDEGAQAVECGHRCS
jgi:D-arabinose 5-phosphate isomerase GutQ